MVECEICGTGISGGSVFTCSYCEGTFCPAHRLPFNHACPRIEDWKNNKPNPKMSRSTTTSPVYLEDKRGGIAGGVIVLFVLIMVLWLFRVI